MSWFSKEKSIENHKDTPEEIRQDIATIEKFAKEGKTAFTREEVIKHRVPIDRSNEYSDWNKAIEGFKTSLNSIEKPVVEEVKTIENAVVSEVKSVEKSIETLEQNTSIQITKSLKELLRSKRQGTESYAETIKRLANL